MSLTVTCDAMHAFTVAKNNLLEINSFLTAREKYYRASYALLISLSAIKSPFYNNLNFSLRRIINART